MHISLSAVRLECDVTVVLHWVLEMVVGDGRCINGERGGEGERERERETEREGREVTE